jgi:hypothetical protein
MRVLAVVSLLLFVSEAAARSVDDVVAAYGRDVRLRLADALDAHDVAWPIPDLAIVVLKEERTVEAWTHDRAGAGVRLKAWAMTGFSGELGPKLRQGDGQIPEGVYRSEGLNPNSRFHLSIRVSYPNADDRKRGAADGRDQLGGDIMIHGSQVTIGCVPIGDAGIEELFVLAATAGKREIPIVIAPWDFRVREGRPALVGLPDWTAARWDTIADALGAYRTAP